MGVKNESALKKCTILYLLHKVNLVPAPNQLIIHKMKCESNAKKSILGQHKMQQLGSANLNDNFHGWLCSAVIDYFSPQQQRTGEIATTCQQKKRLMHTGFSSFTGTLGQKKTNRSCCHGTPWGTNPVQAASKLFQYPLEQMKASNSD